MCPPSIIETNLSQFGRRHTCTYLALGSIEVFYKSYIIEDVTLRTTAAYQRHISTAELHKASLVHCSLT